MTLTVGGLVLVLVATLVLVFTDVGAAGKATTMRVVVRSTPRDVLDHARGALAGSAGVHVGTAGPATLVVTREYHSRWRVFVAIAIFPLGLLALLWRDRETAMVTVTPEEDVDHTSVAVHGRIAKALVARLQPVLVSSD